MGLIPLPYKASTASTMNTGRRYSMPLTLITSLANQYTVLSGTQRICPSNRVVSMTPKSYSRSNLTIEGSLFILRLLSPPIIFEVKMHQSIDVNQSMYHIVICTAIPWWARKELSNPEEDSSMLYFDRVRRREVLRLGIKSVHIEGL